MMIKGIDDGRAKSCLAVDASSASVSGSLHSVPRLIISHGSDGTRDLPAVDRFCRTDRNRGQHCHFTGAFRAWKCSVVSAAPTCSDIRSPALSMSDRRGPPHQRRRVHILGSMGVKGASMSLNEPNAD